MLSLPVSSCLPRLVHSGSARSSPAQGSDLVFATRTGTGRGIESHIFRVETHWDLSSWTRALVQGTHTAAEIIKEVSIGEWVSFIVFSLEIISKAENISSQTHKLWPTPDLEDSNLVHQSFLSPVWATVRFSFILQNHMS